MKRKNNFIEKIGTLIPGYKGYALRDDLRERDKIFRHNLVSQLNELERRINVHINNLIKKDVLKANELESFRKEINTLSQKVQYCQYGASSIFSSQYITEIELENIYQFDLALADLIQSLLNDVANYKEDIENSLNIGHELLIKIHNTLIQRTTYINISK